jgi:hypothetical protein
MLTGRYVNDKESDDVSCPANDCLQELQEQAMVTEFRLGNGTSE